MSKKGFFLLSLLAYTMSTFAQVFKGDTLYYGLPLNYFKVQVGVSRLINHKGPFEQFASLAIPLKESVITKDETTYAISSVEISIESVIDTSTVFPIPVRHAAFSGLLESGLIIGMPLLSSFSTSYNFCNDLPSKTNRFYQYRAGDFVKQYDTTHTDVLGDSALVHKQRVTTSMVAKPNEQLAQEAADELNDIRELYTDLLTGNHETDFSQLPLMLTELKTREADWSVLFTGYVERVDTVYTFDVYPQRNAEPLFFFSNDFGLSNDSSSGAERYCLSFEKLGNIDHCCAAKDKKETRKTKYFPLYVRLIDSYRINLVVEGEKQRLLGCFPIAQWGELLKIEQDIEKIQIDPHIGCLLELKLKTK